MSECEEPSDRLREEFHLLEQSLRMDEIEDRLMELEVGILVVHCRLDAILRSAGIEPTPVPED